MGVMEKEPSDFLTIKIDYENSVSLFNFKESLEGWYNQYNKHLSRSNIPKGEETLLIQEIKSASIDITLISSVMPLLNDYNTIISFFTSIKNSITWLSTLTGKKPKYDIEELKNIKQIVSPVNSTDKSISISVNGDQNTVLFIDKVMVQKINQNSDEEIRKLSIEKIEEPQPDERNREKVLLKFKQVESAEENNKSTKGIISDIDKKAYPVLFDEGLKHPIIHGTDNPLVKYYLVNVKIHRENDKINSYTILKVIDSYTDEDINPSENLLFTEND
jgi:hypothetical protein